MQNMAVGTDALLCKEAPCPGMADVLRNFLPVGILSFGGTAANMAMLMRILVEELRWVDKARYGELLGLVQSLPGPSAVQILLSCITVATGRPLCGIVAVLLFVLPAATAMALLGMHLGSAEVRSSLLVQKQAELQPLEASVGCVAIALVLGGAWELGQKLVVDKVTKGLWLVTCLACFASAAMPELNAALTLACLVLSAVIALQHYPVQTRDSGPEPAATSVGIGRLAGHVFFWSPWLFLGILFVWPLLGHMPAELVEIAPYYRVGCLVFGGGPVVIPLLLFDLISSKAISAQEFSLGFAVVQLMPGPMFNLSAFFGALRGGLPGAFMAWAAMSFPGVSMALGALPFYAELRNHASIQRALKGVNAAAAGLMGAALLLLWQTIVGKSTQRACLALVFAGAQQICQVKAYWLVLAGFCTGLGSIALGLHF